MKYCSHCGNELFEQSVVCPKCGCQVRDFNFGANTQQSANTTSGAQSQQAPKKMNAMCLAGFILSFIMPLLGLILSCIGKSQLSQNPNQDGETFAKAGIIISAVRLVLNVVGSILGTIYALVLCGIVLL